ncbi:MAG: NTP transferase domain-containing protein [Lachnospiraceae bacterium]|nr:NTP transferase domain-containing protein [Lachnospiraceae bacterium]
MNKSGDSSINKYKVDNAIILAAGFGSRFVPLTYDTPKGLLPVLGERMIERQIKQLHAAGITDITLVVGYKKEAFEYLIVEYGVKLVYNPEYSVKNSLSSLYYVRHLLRNTYILTSDNWIRNSLYHAYEPHSWYSVNYVHGETPEWCTITDDNNRILDVTIGGHDSYIMNGPAFLSEEFSKRFAVLLEEYYNLPETSNYYWENIILEHMDELEIYCNCQPDDNVYEFENLEELRCFDASYKTNSNNKAMADIAAHFNISEEKITNLRCLKTDSDENAFLFCIDNKDYVFRFNPQGNSISDYPNQCL